MEIFLGAWNTWCFIDAPVYGISMFGKLQSVLHSFMCRWSEDNGINYKFLKGHDSSIKFFLFLNIKIMILKFCIWQKYLSFQGERLRFSLNWRGRSQQMSRSMCIIIQRCQKPLCISVCGIMPKFTLKYYGKVSKFVTNQIILMHNC